MPGFVHVGQSLTSKVTNTTRKTVSVPVYVDEQGYVQNAGFVFKPIRALEHGALQGPRAIVLHRTVSSTARSSLKGSCDAAEQSAVESLARRQAYREMHNREKAKPYPDRFPMNEDSVGIEVVAMYTEATRQWDPPTPGQSEAISLLARILKTQYSLTDADIYEHDRISRKTAGEGAGLYDSTDGVPVRFPPPVF